MAYFLSRQIFKLIHELAPDHRLKALKVKGFYMKRKKELGCADMYNETSTKRRQWQNEMIKNLQDDTKALKESNGALLKEMKSQLDFMKPNYSGHSKKYKHHRYRSRSKRRTTTKESPTKLLKGLRTISGIDWSEQSHERVNAEFDRMFGKKATRESVSPFIPMKTSI